jgi:peptidoglycan hydrolase-like protein with peptidoglycan-binding domain
MGGRVYRVRWRNFALDATAHTLSSRPAAATTPDPAIGRASLPVIPILLASRLRIRVTFPGPAADPWPSVQMDAYRRGVAAILKKIRANAIMCCGHKEYRLPVGSKPDPTFDMNDFRSQVSAIMAGIAPAPTIIPPTDSANRPTLRRGDTGKAVETIQTAVGVPVNGTFDAATEAAVRQFQRDHGLVPDGIVGPRTWATIAG